LPQPRLADVAVLQLMGEMRDLYAPYARASVTLPAADMHCLCDVDQVRQVLINLFDNALAATEDGGEVRLYASDAGEYIEFHVEDDGEGIASEAAEHIFDAYFSTKTNGSGLGLAIAKRIANEHEGELRMYSTGKPTHFGLLLPKFITSGFEGEA